MNTAKSIIAKSLEPAINFHGLKYKGLKYIEELAGELWTNFNDSDPGVTILEQLCYALTELGYCNNFSIEDILADRTGDIEYQGQFFSPEQSLTTSPITITDFRKLLIEQVSNINNVELLARPDSSCYQVWLYPGHELLIELQKLHELTESLVSPGGMDDTIFYRHVAYICDELIGLIDCFMAPGAEAGINQRLKNLDKVFTDGKFDKNWLNSTSMTTMRMLKSIAVKFQTLLNQANSCLNQHRNIAELFYLPAIVIPKIVTLKGQIHLLARTSCDQLTQILSLSLENYACGRVRQMGYQKLVDAGLQSNDIFNGPDLQHGWITSAELGNKKTTIHLLEIIQLVTGLSEVISIEQAELLIVQNGQHQSHQVIEIANNQVALFNIECQFIQQQNIAQSYQNTAGSINLKQLQQHHNNRPIHAQLDRAPPLPQGKSRQIEDYYSVQNTFPEIYGIGEESLPKNASEQRLAQAKQLKGYLMVFDQLIANQFSQLANTADLFSFKPVSTLVEHPKKFKGIPTQLLPPTYYCQPLYQVPNVKPLLKGHNNYNYGFDDENTPAAQAQVWRKFQQDPFNQYMAGLRACMEDDIELSERRNQILDHLLARHGCSGTLIDQLIIRTRWYASQTKTQVIVKTLILQNWQALSYKRNKAYNCYQAEKLTTSLPWFIWLLKQQVFEPWFSVILAKLYKGEFDNVAHFKKMLFAELKPQIAGIKREVSLDNIRQQVNLLFDTLNGGKSVIKRHQQDDFYADGQVDLEKLSQAEALSKQDFSNYSTFELFANLTLGLVEHYRLLIDTLSSLIAYKGFAQWLGNKHKQGRFNFESGEQSNSVLSTDLGDVIFISEQAVMDYYSARRQPCALSSLYCAFTATYLVIYTS